jgi:hypothetical protein
MKLSRRQVRQMILSETAKLSSAKGKLTRRQLRRLLSEELALLTEGPVAQINKRLDVGKFPNSKWSSATDKGWAAWLDEYSDEILGLYNELGPEDIQAAKKRWGVLANKINLTAASVGGDAPSHMDNFMLNAEAGKRFARGDSGEIASDPEDSEPEQAVAGPPQAAAKKSKTPSKEEQVANRKKMSMLARKAAKRLNMDTDEGGAGMSHIGDTDVTMARGLINDWQTAAKWFLSNDGVAGNKTVKGGEGGARVSPQGQLRALYNLEWKRVSMTNSNPEWNQLYADMADELGNLGSWEFLSDSHDS